ncbi:hypothetical protein JCM5353_000236 [Sporobolomyces roseus]
MAQFGSFNGTSAPLLNGHASAAETQSSPVASTSNATTSSNTPSYSEEYSDYYAELSNHLLKGYTEAIFSDCSVHVNYADQSQGSSSFALHAVVVSRSPLLRSLLRPAFATSPHPTLYLSIPDPSITSSSFSLALASLYSPLVLTHLSPQNCFSILSTAQYLGLDRLARQSFEACLSAIQELNSVEDVQDWVRYLDQRDPSSSNSQSASTSPLIPSSPVHQNGATSPAPNTFEAILRQTLLTRLTSLSAEFGAFNPSMAVQGQARLIEVLKRLSFDWFKGTVEDKRFLVPSEMDRFNFAKRVVAARKQYFQSLASQSSDPSLPPQAMEFDEAVVLGFGSGGQSAVNVLRKARKPNLWKIGPGM